MPPLPGYWHSLLARHGRVWKAAYKEFSRALETKLASRATAQVEHATVRASARQPLHPVARLRQAQSGWTRHFHTATRYFTTEASSSRAGLARTRASYQSATWSAIKQSSGRAPFASTLRPNLTGGTLGRTAGGYSLGGGRAGAQRYFSHGPASQTQVVQNVSQAVRAFMLGGQKAHFNGVDPVTGNKRFKAVTKLQDDAGRKMRNVPKTTPGSHVDFAINPTITALTSMKTVTGFAGHDDGQHLNADGLLDVLSADFSRSLKELAAVLADIRRLSKLGDMPITCHQSTLRIHFPGCDAETVERLCSELNVQRGIVVQDDDFDAFTGTEMALLFPFAPSECPSAADLYEAAPVRHQKPADQIEWRELLTPDQMSAYSTQSQSGLGEGDYIDSWHSSSEPEEVSMHDYLSEDALSASPHSPLEYQGIEGIYRFIEQCDNAARR